MRNKALPVRSLPPVHAFWNKLNPFSKKNGKNSKLTNRKGQTKKDSFDISDVDRTLLEAFYNEIQTILQKNNVNADSMELVAKIMQKSPIWQEITEKEGDHLSAYFSSSESEDEEEPENSGLFGIPKLEIKQRNLCKKVIAYLLDGGWDVIAKLATPENPKEEQIEEQENNLTEQSDQEEPTSKKIKVNQEKDEESLEDDDPKEKSMEEDIVETNDAEDPKSKKSKQQKSYSTRKSGSVGKEEKQTKQKRKKMLTSDDMTELQANVKNAIAKNGGVASFDTIYRYVSKRWSALKNKAESGYPTNADCRTEVQAALLGGPSPAAEGEKQKLVYFPGIFQKAPASSSDDEPENEDEEEDYTLVKWTVVPVPEPATSSPTLSENNEENSASTPNEDEAESPPSGISGKLTDMQGMLMKVILSHGGIATFEQISDSVLKQWKTKKQWGDSKRALLASLSHNPPGNFKKTKEGNWTIAPKAMAIAEEWTREDSTLSLEKVKSSH